MRGCSYGIMDKAVTAMHQGTTSGKNARTTTDVRVSADGKTLVAISWAPSYSTTSQGVLFTQAANSKMVLSRTFPVSMSPHYGFDLSPDGEFVAVFGKHKETDDANVVELRPLGKVTPAAALGALPSDFPFRTDVAPMFSADGKTLALLGANALARWSIADAGAPTIFPIGTGVIKDADLSPDGKTLVSSEDGAGKPGLLGARL